MPRTGMAVERGARDELDGNSMSKAEKWLERSGAKGTARRRKKQADGRRAALGWCPFELGLIRSAGCR